MKMHQLSKLSIGQFIRIANISLYILSAICFMVYTTQQSYTFADNNDEDLGYDVTSANASVTVGTACTLTGTVTAPHTATIANGINSTNIGTTVLNTTCNDTGGYALYAIGYTGNEYGATDLSYTSLDNTTTNGNYNIPTGTATSGNTSNWSMKLSPVAGTTPATIENNYSSYSIVPDDYTKVATLNTITDPGSSITGSSVSTTYSAYISPTQPAGAYTGKVKYTLVHPSTTPKPEKPTTIEQAYATSGAQKTTLGYYIMQDMTSTINSSVNIIGDSLQVQDARDNKIYWVTKLADGNIWMTQNLDLDIEAGRTYTSTDTDLANSAISTSWVPSVNTSTTSDWTGSYVAPEFYDPGNLYWDGAFNMDWNGNLNNGTVTDPSATDGGTHYHIGNYYNWTAAAAMNDSSSYAANLTDVNQSICPAGWRLPTYSGDKSCQNLLNIQNLTSGSSGNIQSTPTYFVYGGGGGSYSYYVGSSGSYWSSVARSNYYAYQLYFGVLGHLKPHGDGFRYDGYSIRCVAR